MIRDNTPGFSGVPGPIEKPFGNRFINSAIVISGVIFMMDAPFMIYFRLT